MTGAAALALLDLLAAHRGLVCDISRKRVVLWV
jgi:hypothetical protein